jgi:diketogulonate reductase-like aldo/keto reductase
LFGKSVLPEGNILMNVATIPTVTLRNGVEMPQIGYGSAMLERGPGLKKTLEVALNEGYRFFDAAPDYENEADVGAALRESGVRREELFVCTKLEDAFHKYEDALKAFDASLKGMGFDYLDLYVIHFPIPKADLYCDAWRALEKLYKDGLVRAIGLSNFHEPHIQKVLENCEILPMVNQLECNPYITVKPLRTYCAKQSIQIINWFPLGGPKVPRIPYPTQDHKVLLEDETLREIGAKYGKTIAQTALRWAVDTGMIPIPKSADPERIRQNRDVFDFSLTSDEIRRIDALDHNRRLGPNADTYNGAED